MKKFKITIEEIDGDYRLEREGAAFSFERDGRHLYFEGEHTPFMYLQLGISYSVIDDYFAKYGNVDVEERRPHPVILKPEPELLQLRDEYISRMEANDFPATVPIEAKFRFILLNHLEQELANK